ncbi:MAG: hypothetical protein NC307_07925 [Roseburia sp.]|nr:hypothetical protein [Roseburia sp.]
MEGKSLNEILERISKLAESYTPEWKFDRENPDAGSVIAMIFAEQTRDNLRKVDMMMENYHREFANLFGVSLRPAHPAFGVAVLSLREGTSQGVSVLKGQQFLGEEEDDKELVFETLHDLYVAEIKLTDVIFISPRKGKKIPFCGNFQKRNFVDETAFPVFPKGHTLPEEMPFFCDQGQGIGTQAFMVYHSHLFEIQEKDFSIRFYGDRDCGQLAELFADSGFFRFYYEEEKRLIPFKNVFRKDDTVVLVPFFHGNIKKIVFVQESFVQEDIRLYDIELVAEDPVMEPDFVWNGTTELPVGEFHPFGQQLAPYREVYIGQQSLMDYSGGNMWMEFTLEFEEYESSRTYAYEPDLRLIKRAKHKLTPVRYDCYIDEASLEYFNGTGWRKLECDFEIGPLFSSEAYRGEYRISFEMPEDWDSATAGGYDQRCIRLQAVWADHCYLPEVTYHYPVIKNLRFGILYHEENIRPEKAVIFCGIKNQDVTEKIRKREAFLAFQGSRQGKDAMYLGFSGKFEAGPIGLYFQVKEKQIWEEASLRYYYSGKNGFKPLQAIDHTRNLQKSGIFLFMPPGDMAEQEIEGSMRYWICVEDTGGFYSGGNASFPVVKKIFVNGAEIRNIETLEEQDYFLDVPEADMHFPLYADNILYAHVWVNEKEELSEEEMQRLLKEEPEKVRAEYNLFGEIEEFYLLWQEVEQFTSSKNPRCYQIDRGKNEILFGDGKAVYIPRNTRSIAFKIQVVRCSGERGNISPDSVLRFRGNMGSVENILVPGAAYGSDMERPEDALKRGSHILSARRRLVSLLDYEREAKLFSHAIYKAACVTGRKEKKRGGDGIRLVLLMRDYKKGSAGFYSVAQSLKQHLLKSCEMTYRAEDIEIVEPVFVKISLKLWLTTKDITESIEIKQRWIKGMEQFLEPVKTGENRGWEIGKLPRVSQIRLMLSSMEKDSQIRCFCVSARYEREGKIYEMDLEHMECEPDMVCLSGNHEVYVNAATGKK